MSAQIDGLFRLMVENGSSDLHLMVGSQPLVRKDGGMKPLDPNAPVLDGELVARLLDPIMPEKNRREFNERHDTDFAYEIAGLARFRANVFMDRKGRGAVFRVIPTRIKTIGELGIPQIVSQMGEFERGLVLVTGPTGSGKSTTLYSCLNLLNEPTVNICTVEDPVEYKFKGMNQVQVKAQVGLTLKAVESKRVWLLGRLQAPGVYPMPAPMLRRGTKDSRDKVQWLIAIRRCLRWSAMDEKKKTPVARRRHRGGGSGYCGVKFW